jgi:hypothetical protein
MFFFFRNHLLFELTPSFETSDPKLDGAERSPAGTPDYGTHLSNGLYANHYL